MNLLVNTVVLGEIDEDTTHDGVGHKLQHLSRACVQAECNEWSGVREVHEGYFEGFCVV